MKTAVIEIGTNSTKYLLASIKGSVYKVIRKETVVNRLSSGMYGEKIITPEAMNSGVRIIGSYIKESIDTGTDHLSIFSTSVLRDAKNRNVFIQMVKDCFGLDLWVISGEQEAQLAYASCCDLIPDSMGLTGVIDIGGGSTELTLGDHGVIHKQFSIDMGAVRLTELFSSQGLLSPMKREAMINTVKKAVAAHGPLPPMLTHMVGTGGTIKTIGTIDRHVPFDQEDAVNGLVINRQTIESILTNLTRLPLEERKKYPGLNPKRADVISAGIIILLTIMEQFGTQSLTISSRGVIEGFLETYVLPTLIRFPGKVG